MQGILKLLEVLSSKNGSEVARHVKLDMVLQRLIDMLFKNNSQAGFLGQF